LDKTPTSESPPGSREKIPGLVLMAAPQVSFQRVQAVGTARLRRKQEL